MRAVDIIIKKRDKAELTQEEIDFFVRGFAAGEIPDYQVSAWAMAVVLNGMTARETADLTLAMVHSGQTLDLSNVVDIAVDKHSSGGVGDKTSLTVLPTVAACGLPVGKDVRPGFGLQRWHARQVGINPGLSCGSHARISSKSSLRRKGIVLCGQSLDLAPADGKLYALRDVTGTVASIPLIASSIMSKKIAAGAQAIVLDVKVGRGAFMETLEEARQLSTLMEQIGELAGRKVVCVLSDMNQPLGHAVGNALEVIEAVETLHGGGPARFPGTLSAHKRRTCWSLADGRLTWRKAGCMAERAIADGTAFDKFRVLVEAQGGDVSYVDDTGKLPRARFITTIASPRTGWLAQIDARTVGEAVCRAGSRPIPQDGSRRSRRGLCHSSQGGRPGGTGGATLHGARQ